MVASIRHQVICLVCRHHIWFCLADRLPVPTGRLARRNSYTSMTFPYPQLFYWAYALVETSVASRGYPRVHMIVWLDVNCARHLGPETIDKIICAEIPDECKKQENENKEQTRIKNPLHESVTYYMLHGAKYQVFEELALPLMGPRY